MCWKSFPGSCSLGWKEAGGGEALQLGGLEGRKEGRSDSEALAEELQPRWSAGAEQEPGSAGQMAELDAEAKEKEGNYSQREGGRGRA